MRLERVHVAFASGDRPAAPVHPNAPVENADGRVVRADDSAGPITALYEPDIAYWKPFQPWMLTLLNDTDRMSWMEENTGWEIRGTWADVRGDEHLLANLLVHPYDVPVRPEEMTLPHKIETEWAKEGLPAPGRLYDSAAVAARVAEEHYNQSTD